MHFKCNNSECNNLPTKKFQLSSLAANESSDFCSKIREFPNFVFKNFLVSIVGIWKSWINSCNVLKEFCEFRHFELSQFNSSDALPESKDVLKGLLSKEFYTDAFAADARTTLWLLGEYSPNLHRCIVCSSTSLKWALQLKIVLKCSPHLPRDSLVETVSLSKELANLRFGIDQIVSCGVHASSQRIPLS